MRIIGGHDYYDGAVPFDTDRTRVFLRDSKEFKLLPTAPMHMKISHFAESLWVNDLIIIEVIFCGKRYRGFVLHRYHSRTYANDTLYFWHKEKLLTYVKFLDRPAYRKAVRDNSIYAEDLDWYFEPLPVDEKEFQALMGAKALVAINRGTRYGGREKNWRVNSDDLKSLNFGSVIPPWEAYQELEMFLGTILVGDQDRMVQLSDKDRIQQHGFDKYSFRNPVHPSKPRHR